MEATKPSSRLEELPLERIKTTAERWCACVNPGYQADFAKDIRSLIQQAHDLGIARSEIRKSDPERQAAIDYLRLVAKEFRESGSAKVADGVDQAIEKLAGDARDAARYRHLRVHWSDFTGMDSRDPGPWLDRTIDAVLDAGKEPK